MRWIVLTLCFGMLIMTSDAFSQAYLKINADMASQITLSYEGESDDTDTKTGFGLGLEFLSRTKPIAVGGGAEFQIPRAIKGSDAKFNFIPIYAAARLKMTEAENHPYITIRIGYNLFDGNSEFTGDDELDLKGGIFTGFGVGYETKRVFLEVGYAMNNGSIEIFGESLDTEYSKLQFSLGVKLGQ